MKCLISFASHNNFAMRTFMCGYFYLLCSICKSIKRDTWRYTFICIRIREEHEEENSIVLAM